MSIAKHPFRFPIRLFRNRMQHVILHITDRCNLRCRSCFVQKQGREMSLDLARRIAAHLPPVRWLDIGGGEPFLHQDLVSICRLFPQSAITIPTNGQEPEHIRQVAQELSKTTCPPLTLAVSLDGFESVNDAIRGAGSFGKAVQTFHLLRSIPGITLKINTVLCQANSDHLPAFMRFVHQLGPDYHSLLLLRGTPADAELRLPPLERLEKITPEVLDILAMYDYGDRGNAVLRVLKKRYQRYLWHICLKTLKTQQCHVPCNAPLLHKVVYPDGSISMCELMPPVGNLLELGLPEAEARMRAALNHYEQCNGLCYCTHNCNMAENIQTHPPSIIAVLLGLHP